MGGQFLFILANLENLKTVRRIQNQEGSGVLSVAKIFLRSGDLNIMKMLNYVYTTMFVLIKDL